MRHAHDQHANQTRQRKTVKKNIAQNGAFLSLLLGCDTRNHNTLRVNHFAHHAARTVGRGREQR